MKQNIKQSNKFLKILFLSCAIFTPTSIFINLFSHIFLGNKLMHVWASLLVFFLVFIISSALVLKKNKAISNRVAIFASCLYTIISFSINLFVFIILDGSLWKIYSIFLILVYSVLVSLTYHYLKVKGFLIKVVIYYALSLSSFLTLTVAIAKYNSGNTIVLTLSIFSAIFLVCSVVIYFIKRSFYRYENEDKEYKHVFD